MYSRTTTWVFRAAPAAGLAAALTALAMVPFGGNPALLSFPCDLILFAYLLGFMRFVTILAALDTGSAFEGMGASREAQFSALAEPALLIGLGVLAYQTRSVSLSGIYAGLFPQLWRAAGPALLLVAAAFLTVFLTENARIPVDDPNTHLELTMIHEVMALDHGGVDFAYILYGAAIKMWLLGSLLVGMALPPRSTQPILNGVMFISGMFILAIVTGIIESIMARLRLTRVPQLLVGAGALSALALVLVLR